MYEWFQYILPVASEGGALRHLYIWLVETVFWGLWALLTGLVFFSIAISAQSEEDNNVAGINFLKSVYQKLFWLPWAPLLITFVSALAVAVYHLAHLSQEAFTTGLVGFGFGILFILVGLLLQFYSVLSLGKPSQTLTQDELKFISPAFLYSTYLSLMALLGGSLFMVGACTWSMDESLWALGFFGSFSSLVTWFAWLLLLVVGVALSAVYLLTQAQSLLTPALKLTIEKFLNYSMYTIPWLVISFVCSVSSHALSLSVVVFSLLFMICSYGVWHLGAHYSLGKTVKCSLTPLVLFALLAVGLIGSSSCYGLRNFVLTNKKSNFETTLKINTYLDTAKVDSSLPPVSHTPSPHKQVQLKQF